MDLSNKKILLIDDDDDFSNYVQAVLEGEKVQFLRVDHPSKALDVLSDNRVDAIILDLNFDNKHEYSSIQYDRGEVILKIRQHDEHLKEIPVIVCSAENLAGTFIKIESIGADHFIAKPVTAKQLLHKLKLCL